MKYEVKSRGPTSSNPSGLCLVCSGVNSTVAFVDYWGDLVILDDGGPDLPADVVHRLLARWAEWAEWRDGNQVQPPEVEQSAGDGGITRSRVDELLADHQNAEENDLLPSDGWLHDAVACLLRGLAETSKG